MDQDTLRRLEEEESELSREVEGLELHYGALHQNTCLMEKRLETQQALLHALTGHRLELVDFMLGVEAGNGFIDMFCPTTEDTRGLSPQEISDMYKQYVSTLSTGLLEVWCEEVVAPGLVDAVEGLSGAMATFLLRLSAVRPMDARQFIALSRQHTTTKPEAFAMWSGVVQKLDLSIEQKAQVLHWHREYLRDVATIRQQGIDLLNCLPQGLFSTDIASEYILVTEALSRHAHTLRAEHIAYLKLSAAVCLGTLTRFQFAALVVASYPAVPDALGVVAGIMAELESINHALPDMAQVVPATGDSLVPPLLGCAVEPGQVAAGAEPAAAAAGMSQESATPAAVDAAPAAGNGRYLT